jgi:hypothetical protein
MPRKSSGRSKKQKRKIEERTFATGFPYCSAAAQA